MRYGTIPTTILYKKKNSHKNKLFLIAYYKHDKLKTVFQFTKFIIYSGF